jgi:RNA polymerase sigma factor (sigma-70 family)
LEASALTHASKRGLLARRSPVLRLQGDERLVAMIRDGHARAFEALFDRYHSRLLAFCQHMLSSREDAEDVLQEVFVAAHKAMLADNRRINVRPWLYRIARNRCLNHLRRPVPEGQDSMDIHPHENGTNTLERVQNREEFRRLLADVGHLPETQRTALLLREIDALSYEEIAQAMNTSVPSVKSLLVRARITLAEASQARLLTCGEVQLELAEAAEGLRKASGPVRQHVRACEPCGEFRTQLRNDSKALAALAPLGALALLKEAVAAKLAGIFGGGTSTAGGGAAAGGAGAAGGAAGAAGAAGGVGGALGGGAAAAGGVGGALGAKAAAGVATAALLTAGAVEVKNYVATETPAPKASAPAAQHNPPVHASNGAVEAPMTHPIEKPAALAETPPAEPDVAVEESAGETATPPVDAAGTEEAGADDSEAGSSSGPPVDNEVGVTPAASYTWTTGGVIPVPSGGGGEEPPAEEPPVVDPPPPPPPPPPSAPPPPQP